MVPQVDPAPQNPPLRRPEVLLPPEAGISSAESGGERDAGVLTRVRLGALRGLDAEDNSGKEGGC